MDKQANQNQRKSLDAKVGEKLNKVRKWTKDNKTLTFIFVIVAIPGIVFISTISEVNWIGFGKDSNKSTTVEKEFDTTTVEKEVDPENGVVIKRVVKVTNNEQSFKTLWDWLQLGGVLAIPLALYYFERSEQRRAEKRNELEQNKVAEIQREDAVENYITQISQLLVETKIISKIQEFIKNIININEDRNEEVKGLITDINSNRVEQIKINRNIYSEIIEQLNTDPEIFVVLDIIRARTLSILRKLDGDGERKGEIIRFLIDVELIDKVDLNSANLSNANLSNANLSNAKLSDANLLRANLLCANLLCANLLNAKLSNTNLSGANLRNTNLIAANLLGANLIQAYLSSANLYDAKLKGAKLEGAELTNITWNENTNWEDVQGLDEALNVPERLLKQLKLT